MKVKFSNTQHFKHKKIMKKIMMTLAAVLCCTMTMTMFTACGGDDDNDNTPTQPTTKDIKGLGAIYSFSVTEQMSQLCDYTITYYGSDNKLATETATWTVKDGVATWQKTASSTVLPANFGLKVSAKVKDNAQLEDVKIDNVYPLNVEMYLEGITTDGKKAWSKTVDFRAGVTTHGSTSGQKLPSFLEVMEGHGGMENKYYTFDKDGNQLSYGKIE